MKQWQLQEAKARLSEVVKQANTKGPQEITLRGKSTAVVLSRKDFDKLTQSEQSLVDFLQTSPLAKVKLDIERDKSLTRKVDL